MIDTRVMIRPKIFMKFGSGPQRIHEIIIATGNSIVVKVAILIELTLFVENISNSNVIIWPNIAIVVP